MGASPAATFRDFKGIDNVDDPSRLHEGDERSGLTSLVEAENVDVDDRRMLSRRVGQVERLAGAPHSIWANKREDTCYFVEGTELKQFFDDNSSAVIRSGLTPGLEMSYVEINDFVVISNSQIIGKIKAGAYIEFGPPNARLHRVSPKPGHIVEVFQNRLLVAVGSRIYYSDSLKFHNFSDIKMYHQFNGYISMMKAVPGGVYVSDGEETFFLAGRDFTKPRKRTIADYKALNNTAVKIDGVNLALEGFNGDVILWLSEKGVCVGSSDGGFINLTKWIYSPGSSWNKGTGFFRDDKNQFITSIHD